MTLIDILKKVTIFENITPSQLREIEKHLIAKKFNKGEDIFIEGETGNRFYIIETGRVKIYKISREGHIKIFDYLESGDFFGEMALLDRLPRSANAVATGDSTLLHIPHDNFQKFLMKNPEIILIIARTLSHRLRKADREIKLFSFSNVRDRVIMCLINLSLRYGEQTDEGILLPPYFTQQEIADFVGTAREVISRIFSELKSKNLISKEKRNLIIKSVKNLKKQLIE